MRPSIPLIALGSLVISGLATSHAHAIEDGMYISLGLGYASVSGTRGQDINFDDRGICAGQPGKYLWTEPQGNGAICWTSGARASLLPGITEAEYLNEALRTEFGQGIAPTLRLGWNIKGYVSPELALFAHGNTSGTEGAALPSLRVRLHPAEFFIHHDKRDWDASLFAGGGMAIGGYAHPEAFKATDDDDGKGWSGWNFSFGASFNYAVAEVFSLGLDLNFIKAGYVTWIVSWNDNLQSLTTETPSTWVVSPTLQMTFHLGDAEEPPKPNPFDHISDDAQ